MMSNNDRLLSLDVLRGFDLLMLVGLQPILRVLLIELDNAVLNDTLLYQLDHAQWEWLRVWDLVMPLFLFMSGVTMPYSLPKYKTQNGNKKVWARVIKRFILLYGLGVFVQGNILALDPDRIYLFSNTLQAIAVGYLLTAPMVLYLSSRKQLVAVVGLLIVYSIPMHLCGDWTPNGNFACMVDKALLGRFRDGTVLAADGSVVFADWYDYSWIWSSWTFCATVALGAYAGHLTKCGNRNRKATAVKLVIAGAICLVSGMALSPFQPIIKRIWTASMVLYSAGWCFMLLALFYWWIDVKGHKTGWNIFLYYGCNAITAYVIGEVINFRGVADSILYGTAQYLGDWYSVLLTVCNSLFVFFILRFMYKHKIFLKV